MLRVIHRRGGETASRVSAKPHLGQYSFTCASHETRLRQMESVTARKVRFLKKGQPSV
jgi:hypothetical protein